MGVYDIFRLLYSKLRYNGKNTWVKRADISIVITILQDFEEGVFSKHNKKSMNERINLMKRIINVSTVILLAICMSFFPISLPYNSVITAEAATTKLNKEKLLLYVGNSDTLKITGTNQKIKWTTSNSKVASVSKKGVVKGIKKGTAAITAQINNKKYTCKVTVSNPAINEKKLDMEIADTAQLSILGGSGSVTWKSSDKDVVTVNKNGFVYAKGEGNAKITGTYKGKNYVCNVTIADKVIHASTTSLVISSDTTIMIAIDNLYSDENAYVLSGDEDIIDCYWGEEWNGSSIPLHITIKGHGKTTLTITADNTDEKLIIDVTAIDNKRPKMNQLKAEDIYDICSPATAQVNTDLGLGSGFFISSGKLVTNYHVIKDASKINVQLNNGKTYDVEYILGYNEFLDIAILSIPVETEYLKISPYGLKSGETVYAIGSSLGFNDTFTNGIISNVSRILNDGVEYIQINAAITNGNSGGPLINSYGEVIGINSMTIGQGQNLNFAINIHQLYLVDTSKPITVAEYYKDVFKEKPLPDNSADYIIEDEKKSSSMETSQSIPLFTYVYGNARSLERDYYKFTIMEESYVGLYGVSIYADDSETSNLILHIYNENGQLLVGSTNHYTEAGLLMKYAVAKLPAGTYYASVSTKLDATASILYEIGIVSKAATE